jgi:6-phosphogluconolactonase (cycloisomerase 2 family)
VEEGEITENVPYISFDMWTDGSYLYVLMGGPGEVYAFEIDPLDGTITFFQSIGGLLPPSSDASTGQYNSAMGMAFGAL